MAANERRLVPPEQRRPVGAFQLALVAVVGFVLGIAVALNYGDAVRQLQTSTAATPNGFTGLLGVRSWERPCPCAAVEEGNGPWPASRPPQFPVPVVVQPDPPTSDAALTPGDPIVGVGVTQAGLLTGFAEKAAGPAGDRGALSLEAAVRAATAVDRTVVFVVATASNLACLHNWYASVSMAGYGLQTLIIAEDVEAYEQSVARWALPCVLVEPHKLNLTQGPRVPQYIRLLLSFDDITVVYNTVDLVWLRNPLGRAEGPHDVWAAAEEQPPHATAEGGGCSSSKELGLSFVVFRPTQASRRLLDLWIVEAMGGPSTDADGTVSFNKAVCASNSSWVSVGVLSPYLFSSRKYPSLRHWKSATCSTMKLQSMASVLESGLDDGSGANASKAVPSMQQHPVRNELWFVSDFDELMKLAREGVAAARKDLGLSLAERQALVAEVLPGAATRHGENGMTLAEAVEVVGGPNRTLIFCSASEGYLDFLVNWFQSVERAGRGGKVLFIAEDGVAYDFLCQRWPNQTVLVVDDPAGREQPNSNSSLHGSAAQTFGSTLYNALVDRRPKYFEALLLLNVTFLYNDVDIVWLRDPWPLFTGNYDVWAQEDGLHPHSEAEEDVALNSSASHEALRLVIEQICTCIMLMQPTAGSLALVRLWSRGLHILQRRAGGKPVPNQPAFNMALRLTHSDSVRVGVLPFQLFPSGFLQFSCRGLPGCSKVQRLQQRYWALKDSGTIRPVMLHNNWIKGYAKKLDRFKAMKLWNVTRGRGSH